MFVVAPFHMFPPHLMGNRPEKKEYIPENLKMPLRVAAFALAVVAIIKFGDQMEMPEPARV